MKCKSAILILLSAILLSACGHAADSFELQSFGEVFASENAVFCMENGTVSMYALNGKLLDTVQISASDLRYDTAENRAVIFGENEILISNGKDIKHNYINSKIMSTNINRNGNIALCAEEAGYKGAVTVYDENFTALYKWYSASAWIIKAALSEKNTLAVLTADENGSTVRVFEPDSEEESFSLSIPKTLAIDICFMGDRLCILSDKAAYFAHEDKITETVSFDRTLGEYAMTDKRLVLEMQNGDGTGELLSFDEKGRRCGSADCEMLRCLRANGEIAAALCGDGAVLFDNDLRKNGSTEAAGVRSVMLCGENMLLLRDGGVFAYK